MNINATSSVSLTLLAAGHRPGLVDAGCFVLSASPSGPKIVVNIFVFVFKYLRTFIRVWLSDDDDPDDWVSFCHDAGHVRRRVIVTETKEWAKDIPVNDKCPHNGPLRLNSTMPALHQDTLARTRGQRNPLSSHWPQGPRGGFWLANLLPRPAPMFTLTRSLNSEPGSDHHKHFPSGSKSCLDALADCDCPLILFGVKQICHLF